MTFGDLLDTGEDAALLTSDSYHGGAFVSVPWSPHVDLLITPGIRFDLYGSNDAEQWSIDPRLAARYRATEILDGDLWIKAGGGIYHQPPRFLLPVPGFDELALGLGLLAAAQVSAISGSKM